MQTNCLKGVLGCLLYGMGCAAKRHIAHAPPSCRRTVVSIARVVILFAFAARTDGSDVCQDGHGERPGGVACQSGLDEHLLPCNVLSRAVGDHEHVDAKVSSAAIANTVFFLFYLFFEFQAAWTSPRIVVLSTRLPHVFESMSEIRHGAQKCCRHDHALTLTRKQTYTQRHSSSALNAWAHGWFMALTRNPYVCVKPLLLCTITR